MKRSCDTCDFWAKVDDTEGECRFNAPQGAIQLMLNQYDVDVRWPNIKIQWVKPITLQHYWCSKFNVKE